MSEYDIKSQRLYYLRHLVREIVDANHRNDMPPLETEEDATQRQQGQGLKMLTPQQMITRFPIVLAPLKAGNNSQKLKNEIRKFLNCLYRSKNLSKTIYNSLMSAI